MTPGATARRDLGDCGHHIVTRRKINSLQRRALDGGLLGHCRSDDERRGNGRNGERFNRRLRAFDAETGKVLWETVVGGMVMNSTISYAVNGKQYVMVFTGEGQSVTAGPLSLMKDYMPPAVHGHNAIYFFALP
jgi:outer membrane protein assembly factor BamB